MKKLGKLKIDKDKILSIKDLISFHGGDTEETAYTCIRNDQRVGCVIIYFCDTQYAIYACESMFGSPINYAIGVCGIGCPSCDCQYY